ncbi:unnamed protein product, partial [Fusarium langsethiae]
MEASHKQSAGKSDLELQAKVSGT